VKILRIQVRLDRAVQKAGPATKAQEAAQIAVTLAKLGFQANVDKTAVKRLVYQ